MAKGYNLEQTGPQVQAAINKSLNLTTATQSKEGLMSAQDKQKLDSLDSELAGKVDKVQGKGLSTNDYDNTEKGKVASAYQKPVGGIPASDLAEGVIPDTSQFITKTVNDLANYYLKTETYSRSETYTKSEVNALIALIKQFTYQVVSELPEASESTMYKLYLVPSADPQTQNVKDEYITVRSGSEGAYTYAWEQIGSTAINLSGYVTTEALNAALANYTTTANLTTLLAAKQDVIPDLETIRSGAAAGTTAAAALTALEAAIAAKYTKPASGIPEADLDANVQAALVLARSAVQSLTNYYTKDQIDDITAAIAAAVNSNGGVVVTALPTASSNTLGNIYYVGPDANGYYDRYVTSYDGSAYSWIPLGNTEINLANYATKEEVSQLEQKVTGLGLPIVPTWQREGYYVANDGTVTASADWSVSDPILLKKNHTIIVKMKSGTGAAVVASTDENGTTYTQLVPTSGYHGNSVTSVYRYTAKQDEYIAVSVRVANDYTVEEAVDGLEKEADMSVKAIGDVTDSPNKFDRFSIVRGGMYAVNASWIDHLSFYSSDFIPVMPGDTVKILFKPVAFSVSGNWTAFKSDKVTSAGGGQANINQSGGSYEFTVPSAWADTRYITIGFFFEIDPSTIVVTVNGNTTFKIPQTAVDGLTLALNGKQNTLTAGDNITIENNVISTKTGVLVDESQNLTDTQKETARENIDAASEGEVTYVSTAEVNATIGFANWAYGYVKPNGTIQAASSGSWKYSDKIPIVPDTPIVINKMYCNTAVASVASYDASDNFIAECSLSQSSSISSSNPVTIQTTGKNVAYIRITIGGGYPDYDVTVTQYSGTKTIKEVIAEVQEQIEGIEEELDGISVGTQWNGKSWVALGTSITDTKNTLAPDGTTTGKFVPYLAALSGLVVTDKGVAGSVVGGHILYYAGHTAETATADIITIEGGVNDWAGSRPLGQVGDTVPYLVEWSSPVWNNGGSSEGTFAGACHQAIKTAMDNSPKAVVVVITDNTGQHIASTGQHCEREHQNSLGLRQKDYTDMLIAVANYMGVPVINAGQKSMINQDNPEYLIDQIHQTELGGEQFANVIWSELKNFPCRITE